MIYSENMLPKVPIRGHIGYYPVCNAKEWDDLPDLYKAMEWFPVEVYNVEHGRRETSVVEYVEFDVVYLEPYKISAKVRVHVENVQKLLFCLFLDTQCHLHSICGVVFENGVRYPAEWRQDTTTGAFGVYAGGKQVGAQGGYLGFIPSKIEMTDNGFHPSKAEKTDSGFRWKYSAPCAGRCHYDVGNPFA